MKSFFISDIQIFRSWFCVCVGRNRYMPRSR